MITKQDQKEHDERQKHKPTGYSPEHLIPPHLRKRHGSFQQFEQAMDGKVFIDRNAQIADADDYPEGEIDSPEIIQGILRRRDRQHIEY